MMSQSRQSNSFVFHFYYIYQNHCMFRRVLRYSLHIMQVKTPAYLLQPRLFELDTEIVAKDEGLYEFKESIFHLQGGGQPNDKGWINVGQNKIQIVGGTIERQTGRMRYKLAGEADLAVGTPVKMAIDPLLRQIHMKIHSGGHLIDLAVQRLKYEWTAGKGYHFTDGPYVEYKGIVENAEKAVIDINNELKTILEQKIESVNKVYSWADAVAAKIIPETFKVTYVRVLGFDTNVGPCGGTHISNTAQIQKLQVVKVQKKGKNVRVFYKIG